MISVERSNLAGGVYDLPSAWDEAQIGFSTLGVVHEILGGYTGTLWWYVGATALALALMAPAVARSWRPMLFFVVVAVGALILSLAERTPLHAVVYTLLPRFEAIHRVLRRDASAQAADAIAELVQAPRPGRTAE